MVCVAKSSSKASYIATSYSFKYLREVKFLISVVKSFTVVLKLCNLSQINQFYVSKFS